MLETPHLASESGKSARPQSIFGLSVTIEPTADTTAAERVEQFVVAQFASAVRLQFIDADLSSKMRMSGCVGVVSMVIVFPQATSIASELSRIAPSSSGVRKPMHAPSASNGTRTLSLGSVVANNIWDIVAHPRGED